MLPCGQTQKQARRLPTSPESCWTQKPELVCRPSISGATFSHPRRPFGVLRPLAFRLVPGIGTVPLITLGRTRLLDPIGSKAARSSLRAILAMLTELLEYCSFFLRSGFVFLVLLLSDSHALFSKLFMSLEFRLTNTLDSLVRFSGVTSQAEDLFEVLSLLCSSRVVDINAGLVSSLASVAISDLSRLDLVSQLLKQWLLIVVDVIVIVVRPMVGRRRRRVRQASVLGIARIAGFLARRYRYGVSLVARRTSRRSIVAVLARVAEAGAFSKTGAIS